MKKKVKKSAVRRVKCWPTVVGAVGVPGWPRRPPSADLFRANVINIYYYIGFGRGFLLFHPRIEVRAASGSPC